MTTHRRYRKTAGRSVWVFSETNQDLAPSDIARVLANAALEAEAEADARQRGIESDTPEARDD